MKTNENMEMNLIEMEDLLDTQMEEITGGGWIEIEIKKCECESGAAA